MATKPTGVEQRTPPKPRRSEGNSTRETGKMDRLPIANADGVLHLHINAAQPEAGELKRHVEGMTSKNTDHAAEPVFNPAVSGAQFRAMAAARGGRSTLGIPQKVGREFTKGGKPKGLPERV
jgi:hypothetical protein